jgi:hypothetical protein
MHVYIYMHIHTHVYIYTHIDITATNSRKGARAGTVSGGSVPRTRRTKPQLKSQTTRSQKNTDLAPHESWKQRTWYHEPPIMSVLSWHSMRCVGETFSNYKGFCVSELSGYSLRTFPSGLDALLYVDSRQLQSSLGCLALSS